jgi:predicted nucleic acid-binding protein
VTPRIYVDTSVIGGLFDAEFEVYTRLFFDRVVHKELRLLVSDLLEAELINAPRNVLAHFRSLDSSWVEQVVLTEESIRLAELYLAERVVGETSRADCRHIAVATVARADALVSWNFQHIVNLRRIRGYNSINLKEGLPALEIRSPKELLDYEN